MLHFVHIEKSGRADVTNFSAGAWQKALFQKRQRDRVDGNWLSSPLSLEGIMHHLQLDDDTRNTLAETIECAIGELRMEIADTDSYDFRQQLKVREATLKRLLSDLSGAPLAA